MSKIETGLHAYHASMQNTISSSTNGPSEEPLDDQHGNSRNPWLIEAAFAKVNSVVAGSPADDAGLRAGDKLRSFGTVNWMNHEKLGKVAEVVQRSEGVCLQQSIKISHLSFLQRSVPVKVVRMEPSTGTNEELNLQLTPRRNWGGRGLLGCHLLPL